MCKGPVVGDRIAYSRTQRGVLYREHRDLLEEGRDDFSDKEGGAAEISCIKEVGRPKHLSRLQETVPTQEELLGHGSSLSNM